jgi:hypothetical protein
MDGHYGRTRLRLIDGRCNDHARGLAMERAPIAELWSVCAPEARAGCRRVVEGSSSRFRGQLCLLNHFNIREESVDLVLEALRSCLIIRGDVLVVVLLPFLECLVKHLRKFLIVSIPYSSGSPPEQITCECESLERCSLEKYRRGQQT